MRFLRGRASALLSSFHSALLRIKPKAEPVETDSVFVSTLPAEARRQSAGSAPQ
jgi:hypothetical protein